MSNYAIPHYECKPAGVQSLATDLGCKLERTASVLDRVVMDLSHHVETDDFRAKAPGEAKALTEPMYLAMAVKDLIEDCQRMANGLEVAGMAIAKEGR